MNSCVRELLAIVAFGGMGFLSLWGGETREVLRLSSAGSNKANGTTTASYWVDAEGQPRPSISTDYDYLAADSRIVRTPTSGSTTFGGHSLTLGEVGAGYGWMFDYTSNATKRYDNGGLVLANGLISTQSQDDRWFGFAGDVRVTAPDTAPFQIMSGYSGTRIVFSGTLKGDVGTGLSLAYHKSWGKSPVRMTIQSDASDYKGTIAVAYSGTTLFLDNEGFPGKLSLAANTTLVLSNEVSLAGLKLAANSVLDLSGRSSFDAQTGKWMFRNGGITVTTTDVSVTGPVTVKLGCDFILPDGVSTHVPILTVPAGVVLDPDDFVFDLSQVDVPNARIVSVDDLAGEGTKSIALAFDPFVQPMVSDSSSMSFDSTGSFGSAMTNATSWSDGQVPHAGADYVVRRIQGHATYLRTKSRPDNQTTTEWTFSGDSLTICRSCRMAVFETKVTIPLFRLNNSASIVNGQWSNVTFLEPIELVSGSCNLYSWCNNEVTLLGGLSGAGDLVLKGPAVSTSAPKSAVVLSGPTEEWSGRILFSYNLEPSFDSSLSLQIASAANFGGNLPTLDAEACVLADLGRLDIVNDVNLAANSNRGVEFLASTGRISVAKNKDFTIGTQLTGKGTLYKEGLGALTLACPVRFGDGEATAPTDDGVDNLFIIAAGDVVVRHAEAVDGLRMSFAEGSGLKLVVDPANAALTEWGIRAERTAEPFAFAGSTLPLTVDVSGLSGSVPQRIGLVTVTNTQVEAVQAALPDFSRLLKGYGVSTVLISRPEQDSTTIALECVKKGLVLIFR